MSRLAKAVNNLEAFEGGLGSARGKFFFGPVLKSHDRTKVVNIIQEEISSGVSDIFPSFDSQKERDLHARFSDAECHPLAGGGSFKVIDGACSGVRFQRSCCIDPEG